MPLHYIDPEVLKENSAHGYDFGEVACGRFPPPDELTISVSHVTCGLCLMELREKRLWDPRDSSDGRDLMTAKEVAELLRVPVSRIHSLTSEGRIPHIKLGHRTLRFFRSEVMEWARQTAVAKEDGPHGRTQERTAMAGRLPLQRSPHRRVEEIPPHDWSGNHEAKGRGA